MGRLLHRLRNTPTTYRETINDLIFSSEDVSGTVTPAGGGISFLFHSDWSTALGTSDAALRDTSKSIPWSARWGGNPQLSVQPASGFGMPASMQNVFVTEMGSGDFDWVMCNNVWDAPLNRWIQFRDYTRFVAPFATSGGYAPTHPLESEGGQNGISGAYYVEHWGPIGNSNNVYWMFDIGGFGGQITTADQTGANPGTLLKNTTYRREWGFFRNGASTALVRMRIYGPDDSTLLWDNSNLVHWGGGNINGNHTVDAAHINDIRLGVNGGFAATAGTCKTIRGGFAVAFDDWIGAYTING